jgi:hypothetical protein
VVSNLVIAIKQSAFVSHQQISQECQWGSKFDHTYPPKQANKATPKTLLFARRPAGPDFPPKACFRAAAAALRAALASPPTAMLIDDRRESSKSPAKDEAELESADEIDPEGKRAS